MNFLLFTIVYKIFITIIYVQDFNSQERIIDKFNEDKFN